MKRAVLCFAVFVLGLSFAFSVPASAAADYSGYAGAPSAADQAQAYYLYNLTRDILITQKNVDQPICPASTVKIMTGLLACEALADRLQETVTVNAQMAVDFSGYCMGLQIGEQISAEALLYAAFCGGYNDAAVVLACHISGSVSGFLSAMNARAEVLGMEHTVYQSLTGLSSGVDSTLADVARSAKAAAESELYMTVTSAREYTVSATNLQPARTLHNRNALIYDNSSGGIYSNTSCRGMSSGNTEAGGWCLATVSEREGERFLCIVLGAKEDDYRIYSYTVANQLLSMEARTFGAVTVAPKKTVYASLPVHNAPLPGTKADLVPVSDLSVYLPLSVDPSLLTYRARPTAPYLTAPIVTGQNAGTLAVYLNDEQVGVITLVTANGTDKNFFLSAMTSFSSYLHSRSFVATVVIAIVLCVVYFRFFYVRKIRHVKPKSIRMRRRF